MAKRGKPTGTKKPAGGGVGPRIVSDGGKVPARVSPDEFGRRPALPSSSAAASRCGSRRP
ncbi:MAG: hypothetical protein FJX11_16750 [Alphaproteobacteria bacterium]|nr:hypothetical protein [Alphaproteobacteria bacterium]